MPTKQQLSKEQQLQLDVELYFASQKGETDYIKELLLKGADINIKDNSDWSVLHTASSNGHIETAKLLLKYGADIHAKDKEGRTAENIARKHGYENLAELLKCASERQKALKETEEQLAHQKRIHDALRRNDVSIMSDRDFLNMLESEIIDKK